jgi:hypothetical protein
MLRFAQHDNPGLYPAVRCFSAASPANNPEDLLSQMPSHQFPLVIILFAIYLRRMQVMPIYQGI